MLNSFGRYRLSNLFIGTAGILGMCTATTTDNNTNHTVAFCSSSENPIRTALYPPIEPYESGMLKVSDVHEIYYEVSGNKNGKAVVVVHGGPGGGTSPFMRTYFDPEVYKIVLFDQRGCGKSTPHASLEENTTWHCVSDIESIRKHLGIEKWQVFGGSWGSTLGLTYAINHPNRVSELVLRGIFMLRQKELQFYYQEGSSFIFPDYWEPYLNEIPPEEQHDLIEAYRKRLTSSDYNIRLSAAKAWTTWEMSTSLLIPNEDKIKKGDEDKYALAFARIENHYFSNKGFFPTDEYILENVEKIRSIPTVIIQGRYDVVCPMRSAWDLHKKFPEAKFTIVKNAGHSAAEVGIQAELVKATEEFKNSRISKL